MALTENEIELNIVNMSSRITSLEEGRDQRIDELQEILMAMADALGMEVGYGPYAVKREYADELARKGVGRIGFNREVQE